MIRGFAAATSKGKKNNGVQSTPETQRNLRITALMPSHAAQAMMPPAIVMTNISTINHSFPDQKFSVLPSNLMALNPESHGKSHMQYSILCLNIQESPWCFAPSYKKVVVF